MKNSCKFLALLVILGGLHSCQETDSDTGDFQAYYTSYGAGDKITLKIQAPKAPAIDARITQSSSQSMKRLGRYLLRQQYALRVIANSRTAAKMA